MATSVTVAPSLPVLTYSKSGDGSMVITTPVGKRVTFLLAAHGPYNANNQRFLLLYCSLYRQNANSSPSKVVPIYTGDANISYAVSTDTSGAHLTVTAGHAGSSSWGWNVSIMIIAGNPEDISMA